MKTKYIDCCCSSMDHAIRIMFDEDDRMFYLETLTNYNRYKFNFWKWIKGIWNAFFYVNDQRYIDIMIDFERARHIIEFLNENIKEKNVRNYDC